MNCNALERGKDWRRNIVQNGATDSWSTRPVNFNLWSYISPSVEIFVVAGSILESAQAQRLHRQRRWRAGWRKLLSRCWTTTLTAQQSLTRLSPVKSSQHCWLHIRNLFTSTILCRFFQRMGGLRTLLMLPSITEVDMTCIKTSFHSSPVYFTVPFFLTPPSIVNCTLEISSAPVHPL